MSYLGKNYYPPCSAKVLATLKKNKNILPIAWSYNKMYYLCDANTKKMTLSNTKIIRSNTFKPLNDEYLALINKMTLSPKMEFSGLRILPEELFNNLSRAEFSKWCMTDVDINFDGFKSEYELIESEIERHINNVKRFYLGEIECGELAKQKFSLMEQLYALESISIPLRKLSLIVEPDYTASTAIHSRSKIKYAFVKAYWINEAGELKRILNKNIGNNEWDFIDVAAKMFASFGFESYVPAKPIGDGILVDMVIMKNNKKWIVEIKLKDREAFIKTFVSLELWRMYKKEYGITD